LYFIKKKYLKVWCFKINRGQKLDNLTSYKLANDLKKQAYLFFLPKAVISQHRFENSYLLKFIRLGMLYFESQGVMLFLLYFSRLKNRIFKKAGGK